ncbi:hypothetical protein GF377_09250 [candidate division GN15 bacterium]|nr:hypothetical protein [candidate division GN15 bacterium]
MNSILGCLSALALAALVVVAGCSGEKTVEDLRSDAKSAFFDEDYREARDLLGQGLTKAPSDREMLQLMARAYRRDFLYDSALFYLSRLDKLYPNDRVTNQQIYEVATELSRPRKAVDAIKVLAESGDGWEDYAAELSYYWDELGYAYNTWYYANMAIERDSLNQNLYLKGATAAARMDSTRLANDMIDRAVQRFGMGPRLQAVKATVLATEGEYLRAEQLLRPLVESDSALFTYKLSLAHVLASQDSRAKKQEALALYQDLRGQVPPEVRLDSTITALESQLAGE